MSANVSCLFRCVHHCTEMSGSTHFASQGWFGYAMPQQIWMCTLFIDTRTALLPPTCKRGCSTINLTTALWQRPGHRAEGAMMVASDHTCVFTEVVIPCPCGELVATAAMPRVFLVSSFAAQLSNDEVALLSVLPNELKAGNPLGYCVLHLVGILTQTAAAELICQLSRDCKLDALQRWVSNSASSTNSPRG